MNRDLELIRDLLLLIEKEVTYDDAWDSWPELFQKGYKDKVVYYHLLLLSDSEYIILDRYDDVHADNFIVERMTNAGHDYLDSIRDPKIWLATKDSLKKVGGSTSLAIV